MIKELNKKRLDLVFIYAEYCTKYSPEDVEAKMKLTDIDIFDEFVLKFFGLMYDKDNFTYK